MQSCPDAREDEAVAEAEGFRLLPGGLMLALEPLATGGPLLYCRGYFCSA